MAEEDQQQQGRKEDAKDGEHAYKTKIIQFFGRSTPIVLQNGNGPCPPLLAICNVLLLRNAINLNADSSEISLDELLSLVAGRLIDSNCDFTDKDDGYVNNQLKNIDDAMKILSKLASRIDVNIHFRKIDDFDITSECVIFDLLDIGLYHGWIVDPQDTDTATAIGSKSYNTLVRELVSLKAVGEEDKGAYEEDAIDFIAATTATLGVPSPCLSRGMSFDDPPVLVPHEQRRRGDLNEAEKLLRASYLPRTDLRTTCTESASPDINWSSGENLTLKNSCPGILDNSLQLQVINKNDLKFYQPDLLVSLGHDALQCGDALETHSGNDMTSSIADDIERTRPCFKDSACHSDSLDPFDNPEKEKFPHMQSVPFHFSANISLGRAAANTNVCGESRSISENNSTSQVYDTYEVIFNPGSVIHHQDFHSSDGPRLHVDVHEVLDEGVRLSIDCSEPIYEGEECILDSRVTVYEEPIYEGEMVLAEQSNKRADQDACASSNKAASQQHQQPISKKEGQLIQFFLENNTSQLTLYGLFRLRECIKERQLCVFFRNNQFCTMFKFNGELYLLAMDEGYINKPELVWEKLNEVNGNAVFTTSDFREFKEENQCNGS